MRTSHPWFDGLPDRYVTGHRGAAGYCPENTMVSFRRAVDDGVHALEMDVRLTSDHHLVVIHDETLERTTNGIGSIHEKTLSALKALDAGYRFTEDEGKTFPWRDRGIEIPTLNEVADAFPKQRLIIEIKSNDEATAKAVARFCKERALPERFLIASFHDHATSVFREYAPGYATGASRREASEFVIRAFLGHAYRNPLFYNALMLSMTYYRLPILTPRVVEAAHLHKLHVQAWTINDPDIMHNLYEMKVNGITSDYPDVAVRMATA